MNSFILIGLMGFVAAASAGLATSHQNIHRIDKGGINSVGALGGAGKEGVEGLGGYESGHWDHHPQYKYEYGVKDHHTGDKKDVWEIRDGDVVKGGYKMKEADGTIRVVEYVADKHHGFNVIVKRIGHAVHPKIYGVDYGSGYGYSAGIGAGQSHLGWTSAGNIGGVENVGSLSGLGSVGAYVGLGQSGVSGGLGHAGGLSGIGGGYGVGRLGY